MEGVDGEGGGELKQDRNCDRSYLTQPTLLKSSKNMLKVIY